MKNRIKTVLAFAALFPLAGFAQFSPTQADDTYKVQIDLTKVENDQIKVELVSPLMMVDEVVYNMPRMVPGTYKVYDFGRFVTDFVALGGRGDTLEVEKLNLNQWKIKDAKNLYKIVYTADDTYDEKGKDIFAPAGTGFEDGVYLLNNFTFLGYFEGYKSIGYEYSIVKPEGLYGSTSLDLISSDGNTDVFKADDYFEIHDCPILYSNADTASVTVTGTKVSIGVHSPKGKLSAKTIM